MAIFEPPVHNDCASYNCPVRGCNGYDIRNEPGYWDKPQDVWNVNEKRWVTPEERVSTSGGSLQPATTRYNADPEPRPWDGPEYHAEYAAWLERNNYKLCCSHCGPHVTPPKDRHMVTCHECLEGERFGSDDKIGDICAAGETGVYTADTTKAEPDMVNSPSHYTGPVPGIECIDVTQHFSLLRGTAIKYLWRADYKGNKRQDLEKAIWYIQKELDTLEDW